MIRPSGDATKPLPITEFFSVPGDATRTILFDSSAKIAAGVFSTQNVSGQNDTAISAVNTADLTDAAEYRMVASIFI